jgi:hypothetical protein
MGIVDDRGEEVGGQHQRAVVVQTQHRGVVSLERTDDQVPGRRFEPLPQRSEQALQLGEREFAGAAGPSGQRGEPDRLVRWCAHQVSPLLHGIVVYGRR